MRRMIKQERDFVRELRKKLNDDRREYVVSFNDPCVSGGFRLKVFTVSWKDVDHLEEVVIELRRKYGMNTRIQVESDYEDFKTVRVFYKHSKSIITFYHEQRKVWRTIDRSRQYMTPAEATEHVQSTYSTKS
jgi:hypothetical protein